MAKPPRPPQPPPFPRHGLPPRAKQPFSFSLLLSLLGGASIIYLLSGYLLVPYLIKTVLSERLGRDLDRPVTIGHAQFNPLTLRLTLLNGIVGPRLSDPGDKVDPLLSFSALAMDLEASSLPRRALICRQLTIDRPYLHLVHDHDHSYNLTALLPDPNQAASPIPAWLTLLVGRRYAITNIAISNGEVIYDDLPAAKVHHLEEVALTLPAITNIAQPNNAPGQHRPAGEQELTPSFSARINGTPVEMGGQARMGSGEMAATLTLKMNDLSLAAYKDYLPVVLGIEALSGQADLDLDLLYDATLTEKLRLTGTISLRSARAEGKHGQFSLESGRIKGWFAPFGKSFHTDEISLRHPVWQSAADQPVPWPALLAAILPLSADQGEGVTVDQLQISNGEILGAATPTTPASRWQAIDAAINTAPLAPGDPNGPKQAFFTMNTTSNTGSGINLQGSATTAPLAAKGLLVISKVDMATIHELATAMGISLPVSQGSVEQLQTNFSLTKDGGQAPLLALEPLNIQAKELKIEYHGQLLEVPVWQSEQGSFSANDPVLHLGRVRLQQAKLTCQRQSVDGSWRTLLTEEGGQANPQAPGQQPGTGHKVPIDLASLDLTNGRLVIENHGPPDVSLRLERFDLQVDQLEPKQANNLSAAAMLDDKFPIQASGNFTLSPFSATLNIQATDLPLASFQPVLARYFASPMGGSLSANGTLSLPSLDYQGQWAVTSLTAPPLSCRRMSGEGTLFRLRPLALSIDRLGLENPVLQVTANANGFPELPVIMQPGWQPAATPAQASVTIKAIDLYDGRLTYDFPGPPGFTLSSEQLDGTISDFTVARDQAIPFDLSGTLEGKGEFTAQGQITPFASQPGLTMTSRVDGLPLTALAQLLEPLWGFTIKAGALDFASTLTYEQTLIHDTSQLTLHDLALGKPLAAQAIKAIGTTWQSLPLIQAMGQDATGAITFTVPIDGRTDTGFTYPQGMKDFLKQLLLKASVAPVNLLSDQHKAAADTLEFEPGSDHLGPEAEGQLRELAALLKDRPLLTATLVGLADSSADSKALLRAKKTAKGPGAINDELLLVLASMRAQAVHDFLAGQGVAPRQLRLAPQELIATSKAGRKGHQVAITLGVAGGP